MFSEPAMTDGIQPIYHGDVYPRISNDRSQHRRTDPSIRFDFKGRPCLSATEMGEGAPDDMCAQTFTYSQAHFGEISVDVTEATGRGGAPAPVLTLPAQLHVWALESAGFLVQQLTGSVVVGHAGGFTLPLAPVSIQRTVVRQGFIKQFVELGFPIARHQVEAIEQNRQGDVNLSLQISLHYLVLAPVEMRTARAHLPCVILDAGTAVVHQQLKLSPSIWTGQVLPNLGHGQILLLEMPVFPVAALATLGEAFEAAKRAQAMFQAGEYDVAVGLCRTVVQPLRNHLKKIKEQAGDGTAGDWAEKIGQATFEWLTIVTGKTHGVGSAAFHAGSSGRFSRLDAQMILMTTFSVLAYAARLEGLHRPASNP